MILHKNDNYGKLILNVTLGLLYLMSLLSINAIIYNIFCTPRTHMGAMEYQFIADFHCVHLYVCRLCINFQDLCACLLGDIPPFFMLPTFISRFVMISCPFEKL